MLSYNSLSKPKRMRAVIAVAFIALLAFGFAGMMVAPAEAAYMQEAPIANAGPDVDIQVGETVQFNGSASVPSEGATIVNYTWNFTVFVGTGSHVLYGVSPSYMFNVSVSGAHLVIVNLTVTDSAGLNDTDEMNVFIREKPPTFFDKYWMEIFLIGIAAILLSRPVYSVSKSLIKHEPIVTEASREKFRLTMAKDRKIFGQLMRNPMGAIGVIILVFFAGLAIFGPALAPYDVKAIDPANSMNLPSPDHWMGTDNLGIDIFSELLYGARTSIVVGMVSAVIASFLGAAVGLYSGYVGGWKDEVVMRLNDIVLSIPWLVLMIVVAAFLGQIDLTGIILIIGLTGWSTTARMVRAQVLSIRERMYVERARSIGAGEMDIIRRHVFPNTFPLVFANTILTVAVSILSEATLSFLGLRPVGEVTWGTMLSFAQEASAFQIGLHWWILAPGLCIVVVVLGFTLLGYALDEILNPKLRHR